MYQETKTTKTMPSSITEVLARTPGLNIEPLGERVYVLALPPDDQTAVGLHIPDQAKINKFAGIILSAGTDARDYMAAHDLRIGDEVQFAKFAGVMDEWDRIVEQGDILGCDHTWERAQVEAGDVARYSCSKCGAVRAVSGTVYVNVGDIQGNVSLAKRLQDGAVAYKAGVTEEGSIAHYVEVIK